MTHPHAVPDLGDVDFDSVMGDPETLVIDATEQPEIATEASQAALQSANPRPQMRDAPEGTVHLPGGWIDEEGTLHRTATVGELTGRAEERLARIDQWASAPLYLQTIVKSSLESIGGREPTDEMLSSLLIGDRDALILGARIATYGDGLEMRITCPQCQAVEDLEIELSKDIPVKEMERPEVREYEVELRRGRIAMVAPATTRVQDETWDVKKSAAEVKTETLARCILSIDGRPIRQAEARELGLGDRKTILDFLQEIQPGPDYGGVRLPCGSCGQEFSLRLDLADLFR